MVLTVELNGTPRVVVREPAPEVDNGYGDELYRPESRCPNVLELPLRVGLRTADGALDESAETVLRANSADFAQTHVAFALDGLVGSFDAELPVPDGAVLTAGPSLSIGLRFAASGAAGEMSMGAEFRTADAVGQGGSSNFFRFPADAYCGQDAVSIAADQPVRGLSVTDALERLNAAFPVVLDTGATLTASFTSQVESTCMNLSGAASQGASLRFDGSVALESSDGAIDGSVDVELRADSDPAGGGLRLSANANAETDDLAQAAALAASYAIRQEVDFSGYDGARCELSLLVTDTESNGALLAQGLDVADCVTNPPPPDPDGMGSPGCRGTDRIEAWGVRWND
jgi:hypothetical protein